MSLTDVIADEISEIEPHKTCCRKALLCGLLYACEPTSEYGIYASSFYRERDAYRATAIIDASFPSKKPTDVNTVSRGGHRAYSVKLSSKSLIGVFSAIDNNTGKDIQTAVGFRCRECEGHFLRGVFLSSATVGQPKSGYHLEFSVKGERRAELLSSLLTDRVVAPGRVRRGEKYGLYYKSNVKIADVLYCIGASKASFDVTNISIERDIRNNENRATNCVTRNISRSVGAASKHIEAIRYLEDIGKLDLLSAELVQTARLRVENDSASLSELALMHEPPITKSGLNGRLSRILAISEEQRAVSERTADALGEK